MRTGERRREEVESGRNFLLIFADSDIGFGPSTAFRTEVRPPNPSYSRDGRESLAGVA